MSKAFFFAFPILLSMIEIITDWLEYPLYWKGVELYKQYGESAFLKNVFNGGEDDYNRGKLIAALTEIRDNYVQEEEKVIEKMPETLTEKLEEARRLMDQRSAIKERLRVYYLSEQPQAELKKEAFLILDINQRLQDIYDEERFYRQTGYLPEREVLSQETMQTLITRRNTLRTYLSRERNEDKIIEFKNEMFAIVKKLEALGVIPKESEKKVTTGSARDQALIQRKR